MATQSRYYSNTAVPGTIGNAGGISNSATSLYLASAPTGYPAQFPFVLELSPNGGINSGQSPEVVLVTAGAGTSGSPWTISRGQDGTTAQAWSNGASVQHTADAQDFTLSRLHEGSVQADLPHGLPSSAWNTASLAAISEVTETVSTNNVVTWSSIPQTYKHLVIFCQSRLTETTLQSDDLLVTLNGDAGAHYSYLTISSTNISGSGTGTLTSGTFAASAVASWPLFRVAASLAGTNVNAGGGIAWIPNYAGTAFNKMFVGISGMGDGTSAAVDGRLRWGFWNPSTQAAITQVSIAAPSGADFLTGSFFGIYGVSLWLASIISTWAPARTFSVRSPMRISRSLIRLCLRISSGRKLR